MTSDVFALHPWKPNGEVMFYFSRFRFICRKKYLLKIEKEKVIKVIVQNEEKLVMHRPR